MSSLIMQIAGNPRVSIDDLTLISSPLWSLFDPKNWRHSLLGLKRFISRVT